MICSLQLFHFTYCSFSLIKSLMLLNSIPHDWLRGFQVIGQRCNYFGSTCLACFPFDILIELQSPSYRPTLWLISYWTPAQASLAICLRFPVAFPVRFLRWHNWFLQRNLMTFGTVLVENLHKHCAIMVWPPLGKCTITACIFLLQFSLLWLLQTGFDRLWHFGIGCNFFFS